MCAVQYVSDKKNFFNNKFAATSYIRAFSENSITVLPGLAKVVWFCNIVKILPQDHVKQSHWA